MIKPEDFLSGELDNVENCIKEVLRNQYGAQLSNTFYSECTRRLDAIRDLAKRANLSAAQLKELSHYVGHISKLLTRIERAHQGEFSWSFANEIRTLAKLVCDDPGAKPPVETLFFFSSDGGLDSYCIWPEQSPLVPAAMPLFNVVFPRTIKHHVLLHPILGHEIFHAATHVPKSTAAAERAAAKLIDGTPINFADLMVLPRWLNQHFGIPLSTFQGMSVPRLESFHRSWVIEFLCDLFGLLLMGPCFVGAQLTILSSFNPKADDVGLSHPPPLCRFWVLRCAVERIGWLAAADAFAVNARAGEACKKYWDELRNMDFSAPWASIVSSDNVKAAIDSMHADAGIWGNTFYKPPTDELVAELFGQITNRIPPVGVQKFLENKPLAGIDFRVLLYVGWLSMKDDAANLKFDDANRLCELGILQQQAVKHQLGQLLVASP